MEFATAMRAVPPLVANVAEVETTDAGDWREGVINAANGASTVVVVCARQPKMKVARFLHLLHLCGTSIGQKGQSMTRLLSLRPIPPRVLPSLGLGVLCHLPTQKKWLRAGAVAPIQTLPLLFRGAVKLATWHLALASVRRGIELQTSGNAKTWPQLLATNSTISVIALRQSGTIASPLRSAMCSRLCRLGRCSRLRRHEHFQT